ncbi:hypothetical protein [Candidatus Absconditicoccus praedator]|uniref:hypothetical protein n=1 Tax=Candidatus Absconditicoccus praedator TaxID=2735562 RepID=UPI001E350D09|nr:hypothetical protein [Candidatus Absconditicoccus praedator]UFX83091.1 hypothetical protein HLG78_03080 [Candidatus Absconditicoccus praedator]
MGEVYGVGGFESGKDAETVKEEVSEDDVKSVEEDQKKAQQVSSQKKQQQVKDRFTAKLLTIIFENLNNENIILYFFRFYKKVKIESLIPVFSPFLMDKFDEEILSKIKNLGTSADASSIESFLSFVSGLIKNHKDLQKLPEDELLEFVEEIVYYFDVGGVKSNISRVEGEQKTQLKQEIRDQILKNLF